MLAHNRAVVKWLKSIHDKFPELVVENCGSGGCRMDYAMLSQDQVQSASDQSDYKKFPSILVGELAAVLPEQLAVWSYPLKDGNAKEASFNMVSAMLCRIHQSGHLAKLPAASFEKVKQGIEVYKSDIAPYIPSSIPFFPLGMPSMADMKQPVAVGLKAKEKDLIAAWRLEGEKTIIIPMSGKGEAKLLYPLGMNINVSRKDNNLVLEFPDKYMAAIVELK